MGVLLEVEDIVKKYGEKKVVNSISFKLHEGNILGLLGPNGAGKSTTISLISGILNYEKGSIKFLGKELSENETFVKQNIGIVPQDIAIYEDLPAIKNVEFFASLYGLKGRELKDKTIEALKFVGMYDRANDKPKTFSGGMKRRLNIACSIAHSPKLLIMDEPTVGIDPHSRNHILESVRKLNRRGVTVIYTSHYMEEVEALCDRIIVVDEGTIIAQGTKEELKDIVNEHKVYTIEVDKLDDVDLKALGSVEGVESVVVENERIVVTCHKRFENLDNLILMLSKMEAKIMNVQLLALDLERVFLLLTGKELRD